MNRKLSIVLLCALIISGGASFVVYRLAEGVRGTARSAPAVQLVAAARDLEIGTLLQENDLKMVEWTGPVPKGSTSIKMLPLNRGVTSVIYLGEPVTEYRLAAVGSGGGLAATIPVGKRACAVRVNEVVGVGGFVTPGMRVDVLITGVPPGRVTGTGPEVKTLLQNIAVLSAGTNIEKDKESKPQQVQVVNLLVTPHEAETLSLAGNETRIQLVLRNPMDTEVTSPPGSFMSELFGTPRGQVVVRASGAKPALTPIVAPSSRIDALAVAGLESIEVLNGPIHSIAKFANSGPPR
jgi:pilus assembly protein CpaB